MRLNKHSDTFKVLALASLAAVAVPTSMLGFAATDVTEISDDPIKVSTVVVDTTVGKMEDTSARQEDMVESAIAEVLDIENGEAIQINTTGTSSILEDSLEAGISSAITGNEIVKTSLTEREAEQKISEQNEESSDKLNGNTVYKPSSRYIHLDTCEWVDDTCVEVPSYDDIEAVVNAVDEIEHNEDGNGEYHVCEDCRPVKGINYGQSSETSVNLETGEVVETGNCENIAVGNTYSLTDYDIILLRKIVSSEYGSDWVPVEEKARVVAGVMNRVYDPRFPNTVYDVLVAPNQFSGFNPNADYYMSDSIIAAVDYYFQHPGEFDGCNSWWGDGQYNHFYYQ